MRVHVGLSSRRDSRGAIELMKDSADRPSLCDHPAVRIEMYSASDKCLYVNEEDISGWICHPWIRRKGILYSLRDLTDDPDAETAIGCVFYSTGHGPYSGAYAGPKTGNHADPAEVRNGWIYFYVVDADAFLDGYKPWFPSEDADGEMHRKTLRESDRIGVITGPVDTIVFTDLEKHWPAGVRNLLDPTMRPPRRPRRSRP